MGDAMREMPRYKCHKVVHALKIARVDLDEQERGEPAVPGGTLHFVDIEYAPARASPDYVAKHKPVAGGYYVVYADGYQSWSPAEAFEAGYTRT